MKGSVRQRSPGTWTITFELARLPDGRRKQQTETFRGRKSDADALLTKRLHEVNSGTYAYGGERTFNDLADAFLVARKTRVEKTSHLLYERHLAHHVRPVIGHLKLKSIKAQHVEELLASARGCSRKKTKKGKALASGTLRNIFIAVRACLQYGITHGWIASNVTYLVKTPSRDSDREPVNFRTQDLTRLLAAVRGTEIEAMIVFAIGTGCRRGEICGLKWSDLDLDAGRYVIRRSAANIGREVVYKRPKSKHSMRSDSMPAFVIEALRKRRREQQTCWLALGLARVAEDAFVFTRADASPWDPNEVSRQFSRLVQRKKLPHLRFHDLRHGHASLAYAAGVPLKTISGSLGHSSIGITSEIYVHLTDEGRSEKADRLDSYLREAVGAR